MHRFAVILTHNRPDMLRQCVAAVGPQVDMVLVIDNASDPPVAESDIAWIQLLPDRPSEAWRTCLVEVADQPPNLSKLWALGIRLAEQAYVETWGWDPESPLCRIAVLCDDAIVPEGWFDAVCTAMAETGAAVGASNPFGGQLGEQVLKRAHDTDLMGRMPGWAWILDPASPVRPDGRFAWWWGDTDIDWQARLAGGTVIIGGYPVTNLQPNYWPTQRPELSEQIARDSQAFVDKYGSRPW